MLIALAALMAIAAFVVLTRLLWVSARPSRSTTFITVAAAALVIGLGVLAATGKLSWIAAVAAAALPFLKRIFSLVRYLPWLRGTYNTYQNTRAGPDAKTSEDSMDFEKARQSLGLGSHPTRDEVISAHRRLIQKIHPDRGGSTYLAQQLNDAKRILLKHLS